MYFAYDQEHQFYYYGEVEPRAGLYTDFLTDPKVIAVDTETISLKERIAIGVGISPNPRMAFYFPLFPEPSSYTPWGLLKDPNVKKLFQNAPFDLLCLREYEIYNGNIGDTNVLAQLLNIRPSKLINLANYMEENGGGCYEVHTIPDILDKGQVMLDLPEEKVAMKCCQDAVATHAIHDFLLPKVDADYYNTEMELIPILIDMSFKGILLDQVVRARLEKGLEKEVSYYIDLAYTDGFNPSSSQQVGYMLAKRGAYSVFRRIPFTRGGMSGKKQLSTSVEVLEKMNDPLAAMVLDYRAKSKLLSTYIRPWAKEERASTRFHLDAVTGRISSTDRNLQNIPKGEVRNMFLPDSGIFTDADLSQIELRVLAHVSGDREMQYIYSLPRFNADGTPNIEADIHQQTADFLGIPRRPSKNVNFSMIYGGTDETIMETAHIKSLSRAKQLKEMWFEKWKEAGDYIQTVQEEALRNPYATTLLGRKIKLPTLEEESEGRIRRKAVNYPIQGSAAEIIKRAMIRCKDLPMVMQVHDELIFDGYVSADKLEPMESIAPFPTPIDIKYLQCWE